MKAKNSLAHWPGQRDVTPIESAQLICRVGYHQCSAIVVRLDWMLMDDEKKQCWTLQDWTVVDYVAGVDTAGLDTDR